MMRLMRLALLAVAVSSVIGCRGEPRDEEARARDESTFITRPSGVGDESAVYPIDSSDRTAPATPAVPPDSSDPTAPRP